MKIRQAELRDHDNLVKLMQDADNRSKNWAETRASRYLLRKRRAIIVAENDKGLIGFVGIKDEDEDSRVSTFLDFSKNAHVPWIALLPKFRGKGIGSRLIAECEKYALEFGKEGIWTDCRQRVVDFYLDNGYAIAGIYKDQRKDRYVMLKRIDE